MNLKPQLQRGMVHLIYLTDCILYQTLKIYLCTSSKKHGEKTDSPTIRIYTKKKKWDYI